MTNESLLSKYSSLSESGLLTSNIKLPAQIWYKIYKNINIMTKAVIEYNNAVCEFSRIYGNGTPEYHEHNADLLKSDSGVFLDIITYSDLKNTVIPHNIFRSLVFMMDFAGE